MTKTADEIIEAATKEVQNRQARRNSAGMSEIMMQSAVVSLLDEMTLLRAEVAALRVALVEALSDRKN